MARTHWKPPLTCGLLLVSLLLATNTTTADYAGLETRPIAALSADDITALLNGEGMSMALPAELNGYPGPKHVLELAEPLALSETQRAEVHRVFDAMNTRARELGAAYVEAERELDALFDSGRANDGALRATLARVAQIQANLRHAHLAAHLETRQLLRPAQVQAYVRLRGYDGHGTHDPHRHAHP